MNSADDVSVGSSGAVSADIQLGVYAYCRATVAVFPDCRYSTESTACGSSQPAPVVVATTSTFRSKPPVRSSSRTAVATRSARVPPAATPTYTRIGVIAGLPVSSLIWDAVGPPAMKSAPWRPSWSNSTSEPAPADRYVDSGTVRPTSGNPFNPW